MRRLLVLVAVGLLAACGGSKDGQSDISKARQARIRSECGYDFDATIHFGHLIGVNPYKIQFTGPDGKHGTYVEYDDNTDETFCG